MRPRKPRPHAGARVREYSGPGPEPDWVLRQASYSPRQPMLNARTTSAFRNCYPLLRFAESRALQPDIRAFAVLQHGGNARNEPKGPDAIRVRRSSGVRDRFDNIAQSAARPGR